MDPAKIELICSKVNNIENVTAANSEKIKENSDTLDLVMSRIARLEKEIDDKDKATNTDENKEDPPSLARIMNEQSKETGTRPRKNPVNPSSRNIPIQSNQNRNKEPSKRQRIEESNQKYRMNLVNTNSTDVMCEAKRKIGLAPISESMIRAWIEDKDARDNDTPDKVSKGSSNHVARVNTAIDFLEDKLFIPLSDIYIKDVKMCRNPDKGILWIESDEKFIRRIFYKASIIQSDYIRVIQYTPHKTFCRKVAIDDKLKETRGQEPNLKNQVHPGTDDREKRLKTTTRHQYDSWDIVSVEDIDPEGKIPKMKITHSEDNPKVREFIRKKEKILDEEGYETVTNKRKASSPRNNEAKRTMTTPDDKISFSVCQVLERTCNRPVFRIEDEDSSDESDAEDNIRSEDYDNVNFTVENEEQDGLQAEAAAFQIDLNPVM